MKRTQEMCTKKPSSPVRGAAPKDNAGGTDDDLARAAAPKRKAKVALIKPTAAKTGQSSEPVAKAARKSAVSNDGDAPVAGGDEGTAL